MRAGPEDRSAPLVRSDDVVQRRAARVVFLDEDDAVLLMSARDPAVADGPEYWFTPGGGTEPGETLEAAARREVREEVGQLVDHLGPVVWERTAAFDFDGVSYSQDESFFVVRTSRFEAQPLAFTDYEERSATGWRWWPVAELAATDETIYPPELALLVRDWSRDDGAGHRPPRRID